MLVAAPPGRGSMFCTIVLLPGYPLRPWPILARKAGAFQHFELAANADGAQIGDDPLSHVEIWRERHVPLVVEAVRKPRFGEQLLRLLRVVLGHRQLLAVTAQRVTLLGAEPVAPRGAYALRLLFGEERPVERQARCLTDAFVVKRAVRLAVPREHQPPGRREVGVPAQVLIRHHAR